MRFQSLTSLDIKILAAKNLKETLIDLVAQQFLLMVNKLCQVITTRQL
jgi:hypothetical protein